MVVRTAPPMVVQMAVTMAPPKVLHSVALRARLLIQHLAAPLTDKTVCLRAC